MKCFIFYIFRNSDLDIWPFCPIFNLTLGYLPYTPGNLDCLNKMLNHEKVNGSFRLRQSRAFEAKQVRSKHTDIHIIEVLITVTKIEECYLAPYRLRKIIIAKYLLKSSFLSHSVFLVGLCCCFLANKCMTYIMLKTVYCKTYVKYDL